MKDKILRLTVYWLISMVLTWLLLGASRSEPEVEIVEEPTTQVVREVVIPLEVNDVPPIVLPEDDFNEPEMIHLGTYKLTAYCSCEECCGKWASNRPNGVVYGSTGEVLTAGYSIAVDPKVIPYGTELIIDGKTYKAQDCGGAIKGNRIDMYFDSHKEALDFGVQHKEVYKVKEVS